jgi:hypothetical protein
MDIQMELRERIAKTATELVLGGMTVRGAVMNALGIHHEITKQFFDFEKTANLDGG